MVLMGIQGLVLWALLGFHVGDGMIVGTLVLFMMYVIMTVQGVLRKSRPSPSTAMLAAVKLYSGFLNIFLRILHLMLLSKMQEQAQQRVGATRNRRSNGWRRLKAALVIASANCVTTHCPA